MIAKLLQLGFGLIFLLATHIRDLLSFGTEAKALANVIPGEISTNTQCKHREQGDDPGRGGTLLWLVFFVTVVIAVVVVGPIAIFIAIVVRPTGVIHWGRCTRGLYRRDHLGRWVCLL